jgi:hypothetical protein
MAPNQAFGQPTPTRYFHMCAYAYVMSKRGAEKMMKLIESRDGYFAVSDHMMCDPIDVFNTYVIDPIIGGCYQDDDPSYAQSQFNNYGRVDKFDSDLWTNDERWTLEEREAALAAAGALDIKAAINDLYSAPVPAETIKDDFMKKIYAPVNPAPSQRNLLVRGIDFNSETHDQIMEIDWLEKMLDVNIYTDAMVSSSDKFNSGEVPWIFVSRADLHKWMPIFNMFLKEGRNFYAIHISDEFGKDDISWYSHSTCKAVIRTYYRADADLPNVITLPLGYARGTIETLAKQQLRDLAWSFEGTSWFGRSTALAALDDIVPNHKVLHPDWNSPGQKSRAEYAALISRSKFVPIVRGNHFETFRLYEALEAGAIPIYVRETNDDVYWNWLKKHITLVNIPDWTIAAKYMRHFLTNSADEERYRKGLVDQWTAWKADIHKQLAAII